MVTKLVWSSLARKLGSATTPEAKQLQGDEKDASENVQTEKKQQKQTIPQKVQTGLLWLHRQARLNDERAGLCLFRTTTLLVVGVLVLV